jgi:hypothetical protein
MIYLDNAAISWPKPRVVMQAMSDYLERARCDLYSSPPPTSSYTTSYPTSVCVCTRSIGFFAGSAGGARLLSPRAFTAYPSNLPREQHARLRSPLHLM